MKLLVTGRSGQVAASIRERAALVPELDVRFAGRPAFDLADESSIRSAILDAAPDVIVNAAAYTAVDQAEQNLEAAEQANGRAPAAIAAAAKEVGAALVHLSTDYVFDGRSPGPYREDDPIAPINAYGRTKLGGEEAVRAGVPNHVILRTAWVYSPFGKNFVKTMLALAADRDQLTVVDDQIGNPTSALDIADAIFAIVNCWRARPGQGAGATYHFAGRGSTSWAGFARHIFDVSRSVGGPFAEVINIPTERWPTPAARPRNSQLESSRFEQVFGYASPEWTISVEAVVRRILADAPPSLR